MSNIDTININGIFYDRKSIKNLYADISSTDQWVQAIVEFLTNWFNSEDYIISKTSGSTGKPKEIYIPKTSMIESAKSTIAFLNLEKNQTALLCLSPENIGGKMMLVRAIVQNLKIIIVKPSLNPLGFLKENETIDFAAMTPLQIKCVLENNSVSKINNIKKLILGGAPLSKEIENNLQKISSEVYETFGMTETISHIALRRVNGTNASKNFKALKGVQLGLDNRNCLTVHAPKILKKDIVTNDIVEFHDINCFKWLGRIDNIINSGGIKIIPELLELKVSTIYNKPFFITGLKDAKFGEKVTMIIEGEDLDSVTKLLLLNSLKEILPKNHAPKEIISIVNFLKTPNGKIKRKETLDSFLLGC
jgi:o-succinylbenzoate---CoA ligase